MLKLTLERMLNAELHVHLGRRGNSDAKRSPAPVAEFAPGDSRPDDRAERGASTTRDNGAAPARRGPNRRNGHISKRLSGDLGESTLDTPRDRSGTFEPRIIPKHQRRVPGFDEKILALYSKGMTTRDIQEALQELYGVEVSPTLISDVTADIDALVTAWRTRPVEPVWAIVYFDGTWFMSAARTARSRRTRCTWPWA